MRFLNLLIAVLFSNMISVMIMLVVLVLASEAKAEEKIAVPYKAEFETVLVEMDAAKQAGADLQAIIDEVIVARESARPVAPELIERQTAPAALTVAAEPQPNSETSDTRSDLPAIPESSEISDDNESGAELFPPFSIFASLAESAIPLIYPADAPAVAEPQRDAAVPVNVLPAAEAETTAPGQPVASAQPTPAVTERSEIERFMAKLAQQQLNDQVRVAEVAEGVYLEVNDNILFALGSAELKNEGAALLDDLAQLLLEQSGIISVEGHTDDRPIATSRFPSNWELSSGRATTVTRYLIGKGLDRERMRAVGYADTRPLASNSTTEGRARNRRVALIVEIPRR